MRLPQVSGRSSKGVPTGEILSECPLFRKAKLARQI
jgi:hypothetical protein